MAMKLLPGGWEQLGDRYRVWAEIPNLPDGSVNVAVLNAALLSITRINADAFSPLPIAHHATEAPMPPAVFEELIARAESDDGPDGLKAGEAYRDHGDGTP